MLTKEQIEAEGWEPHKDYPENTWTQGPYRLRLYREKEYWINKASSAGIERIFAGDISSIEEFKFICKLIKIQEQ